MPKLMIAAGIFHPESGGPATYLKEILPALQSHDWQGHVLTYGDDTIYSYPYPVQRIPRQTLPLRLFNYWNASRPIVQKADLIYAHTIDLPVAWANTPRIIKIVGDQAWERCIRRAWISPTTDIDDFQHKSYSWLVDRQQASRAQQVRDFDAVIVPSNYLKQMVIGWGVPENHVHVIYNTMPPAIDNLPQNRQDARAQLGWDDTPTIVTAARLTAWKGVDHLIEAIKQVDKVRLIVAGDGDQMPYLRQLAKPLGDRVQLLGRVPREKLYVMMQASDYFALYSGYEGLPHTILEALRVGTPIIASDKGGNPEVVQHTVNGLLVPYVDVDALAETIATAIQPDTQRQLASNTHLGMERFDFQHMVTQTDKVLRQYIS
ncbi:MAG: glycosyltransferase family 4 protein [Chloroflexota bacterium]